MCSPSRTLSIAARRLVPLMTRIVPGDEQSREAIERLRGWDFRMDADDVAPLLPKGTILEVGYFGSKGTHLLGVVDMNQPLAGQALDTQDAARSAA